MPTDIYIIILLLTNTSGHVSKSLYFLKGSAEWPAITIDRGEEILTMISEQLIF